MMQPPRRLGAKQAAHLLGISMRTLADWRLKKCGPSYFKVSKTLVLYNEEELNRWLQKRRVECDE